MGNIDQLLVHEGLNHQELSNEIGNSNNWFNDAFNNNEDIRISSLIKIMSVISNRHELRLDKLFDHKISAISSMMTNLSYEHDNYLNDFIISEKDIFIDIIGDWAAMISKNKLNNEEQKIVKTISTLISDN